MNKNTLEYSLLPAVLIVAFFIALRDANGIAYFSSAAYFAILCQICAAIAVIAVCGQMSFSVYGRVAFIVLFAMFLFALFSGLSSGDMIALVAQRAISVFIPGILLMLAVFSVKDVDVLLLRVAKAWVYFVLLLCLVAIILRFFGSQSYGEAGGIQSISMGPFVLEQRVMGVDPMIRVSSLAGNPNLLAIWIFVAFPFLFYMRDVRKIGRVVFWSFCLVFLFVLLMTFSRGGWLGFVMSMFFYFLARKGDFFLRLVWVFFGVLAGLLLFQLLAVSDLLPASRLSSGLSSRDSAWAILLDSIYANVFTGIGFGVSGDVLLKDVLDIGAHSFYLSMLAELGIVGLLGYLMLCLLAVAAFWNDRTRNIDISGKAVAISIIGGLFFQQFFEGQLFRFDVIGYLWFFMLAVVLHNKVCDNNQNVGA